LPKPAFAPDAIFLPSKLFAGMVNLKLKDFEGIHALGIKNISIFWLDSDHKRI